MENIIEPTFDFDFSKLNLGLPVGISGGSYFTKILYNNKPLYVQTPKSLTKQGFIKNGKKIYSDLMFTNFDNVFIDWFERLQNKCEDILFEKGETWFETKLEKDDIETAFTSPIKIFKSGKNYLIRVNSNQNVRIYDENNNLIDLENITNDKHLISILEIQGIKFTSKNFQIEIDLKQGMIVSPDPFLEKCFIKNPNKNEIIKNEINSCENDKLNIFSNNVINSEKNISNDLEKFKKIDKIETIDVNDLINSSVNEINKSNGMYKANVNNINKINDSQIDDVNKNNIKMKKNDEIKNKPKKEENNEIKINIDLEEKNLKNDELKKNIVLDIEDLTPKNLEMNISNEMVEITDNLFCNDDDAIKLKNRNQVYDEIYQKAKNKAKELKNAAIVAYMELKNIKNMYMLDNVYDSESDIDELNMINLDDSDLED